MAFNRKQRLRDNIEAIRTAFLLDREQRTPTARERLLLERYCGFGGLKSILNPARELTDAVHWAKSDLELFAPTVELHRLLRENTKDETEYKRYMDAMKQSVLTAFYTPPEITGTIADVLHEHGIRPDRVLEPSAGVGAFVDAVLENRPDADIMAFIALSAEEQRYMRPFTYKGRAYQRIESVTSAMPQGIYNLLVMQRGGTYAWDSMQNPSLKISDLDETAILGAVRGGIRGGRLPEGSMQEDVRTILEKFDLLNDGKLNNASVVLFGRNFYHYPQCLLRLARFKGTTKDEFLDNQRVTGNIFNLLDAAMAFFFKHLSLSGKIEGLYREEELNVPYKALRECCINAFAHRVYHRPGSSVGIAIYDDRVEIENSGTFPPDITIEKLLGGHNSEPQNLIVANVLYKSAVLESWGRGIALMVNECRRVGIPDPEFHTDGNAVWIVFHYTRTTVGQDPTATPQQPYSNPTVTPQLGKLLSAIGNNTLSAKEIMEKTGMKDKRNFLKNYIHPAINSGLVLSLYPIGSKSPQQKYYLTDKGKGFLQQ